MEVILFMNKKLTSFLLSFLVLGGPLGLPIASAAGGEDAGCASPADVGAEEGDINSPDAYSLLETNSVAAWAPASDRRMSKADYQGLIGNGDMTTSSGEDMMEGECKYGWCIAHVKAHMADIANRNIVRGVREFPTKVYTRAIEDDTLRPTTEPVIMCSDTWEVNVAERVLATHPEWAGRIMIVDSANNVARGGRPAGANTQEESQFSKSLCNYYTATPGAKRYYSLGVANGWQFWNGMLMLNVPHYKSEHLINFVGMTKALDPAKAEAMDLSMCNRFNVWVHASRDWTHMGAVPTDDDLREQFSVEIENMYKVARLNGQKAIVVTGFGTGAFANGNKSAPKIFEDELVRVHSRFGGGIEVYFVKSTPNTITSDQTMGYLEAAYNAVRSDEEKVVIAQAAKKFKEAREAKCHESVSYTSNLAAAVAKLPATGGVRRGAPCGTAREFNNSLNEAYHYTCSPRGAESDRIAYVYRSSKAQDYLKGKMPDGFSNWDVRNGADSQVNWWKGSNDHFRKVNTDYDPKARGREFAFFVQIGDDPNVTCSIDRLNAYSESPEDFIREYAAQGVQLSDEWIAAINAFFSRKPAPAAPMSHPVVALSVPAHVGSNPGAVAIPFNSDLNGSYHWCNTVGRANCKGNPLVARLYTGQNAIDFLNGRHGVTTDMAQFAWHGDVKRPRMISRQSGERNALFVQIGEDPNVNIEISALNSYLGRADEFITLYRNRGVQINSAWESAIRTYLG